MRATSVRAIPLDEWQKMMGLRCNITKPLAYFYTKGVVRRAGRPGNNPGRRNFKIDFKPHV